MHDGRVDMIITTESFDKFGMIVYRDFAASEAFDAGAMRGGEEGSKAVPRRYR